MYNYDINTYEKLCSALLSDCVFGTKQSTMSYVGARIVRLAKMARDEHDEKQIYESVTVDDFRSHVRLDADIRKYLKDVMRLLRKK